MSVSRGLGQNGGWVGSNITKPVKLDMSFIVDATNTNGLGVSSVKSNGYVRNVFMHTSATPGANNGVTNPNPIVGYAMVQFNNNFNAYLNALSGFVSPVSGGALTSVTINNVYVITSLGTATLAQWLAKGVPAGVTPAVGVSFIAIASGTIGGSAAVKVPGVSSVGSVEVVGNPNVAISNSALAANGGAYLMLQFLKPSFTAAAYTPAGTISAPALTMNSYTPAGTNSAPALTMNSYTPAGTNDGGSPPLFTGTPAVLTGSVAAPGFTGSAATLTGSVAAPVFTGSAASLTGTIAYAAGAPADLSVVNIAAYFDASSVTIDGL